MKLNHPVRTQTINSEATESTRPSSPSSVSRSSDELSENSCYPSSPQSALTSLDEETEEFLRFPPSNQQTLDCEWYQKLIDKKRSLTEAGKPVLPRSPTIVDPSVEGKYVY